MTTKAELREVIKRLKRIILNLEKEIEGYESFLSTPIMQLETDIDNCKREIESLKAENKALSETPVDKPSSNWDWLNSSRDTVKMFVRAYSDMNKQIEAIKRITENSNNVKVFEDITKAFEESNKNNT